MGKEGLGAGAESGRSQPGELEWFDYKARTASRPPEMRRPEKRMFLEPWEGA